MMASRAMRHAPRVPALASMLALLLVSLATPAAAQQSHVIVVSGLGGADEYRDRFHEWSIRLVDAAIERHGIPADQVVYLAERPDRDPERIRARSTWENVQTAVTDVAERSAAGDLVFIILIGHGSSSGGTSQFNLPGPDPTIADFAVALEELGGRRVVFINTASASGEFIAGLSGENRTIITATKTARERNETKFGGFFVDAVAGRAISPVELTAETDQVGGAILLPDGAIDSRPVETETPADQSAAEVDQIDQVGAAILLPDGVVDSRPVETETPADQSAAEVDQIDQVGATVLVPDDAADPRPVETETPADQSEDDAADINKDGRLSLLEAFNFARQEVARLYEQDGLLLTEHAMIDDNGDGQGSDEPDPIAVGADGRIAQAIFFASASGRAEDRRETDDPALLAAYDARDAFQQRVAAHQMLKDSMEPAVYDEELERLFIELALKNREIRQLEAEVPQP